MPKFNVFLLNEYANAYVLTFWGGLQVRAIGGSILFLLEAQNPVSNHSCPAIRSICLALQARQDATPIGAR